ncbi:hypothetical protein NS258_16640 [Sphingomonas sanguinis]|uniref:Uncharacterized protein n=1 Tax=Sphingomonas sanguinis TaxID=33051 RepID=A0A147J4X5_9SPHN|nr:hypothetical protein NS258_16640 [Sphingomonas sanguinis]
MGDIRAETRRRGAAQPAAPQALHLRRLKAPRRCPMPDISAPPRLRANQFLLMSGMRRGETAA